MFDNSKTKKKNDKMLLEKTQTKNRIIIINKSDLENKLDLSVFDDYILMSALLEKDICELETKINSLYRLKEINTIDATYIGNSRHLGKLHEALKAIKDALVSIEMNQVVDMINLDISIAWKALGDIVGANASDSLINELFSKFCLGK